MTIGRPQGVTWIGKPLDLVIPLALEDTEKGDSLCLEAEVVQGDARLDDRRVTVSLEPGSSAGGSRLRVRSTVAIEEPVVNVTVRAGCDARSIRTYVLLADVPPEAVSLPRAASSASRADSGAPAFAPQERGTRSSRGSAGAGSAAIGSGGTARRSALPRPRNAESGERTSGTPPPAPRRAAVAQAPARVAPAVRVPAPAAPVARVTAPEPQREAVATGPRLQVDALEPLSLREVGLQTSSSLALPGSEDLAKRAQAAAQWRALSAPPEDAQREAQRIQSLEATLAALREQTAQNQRTLLEMRSELAEARDSRYNNPLVYALGLLLLLALVAIGLLWRLSRRAVAPAWWGDGPDAREGGPRPGPTPDSQFDDLVDHPATQPDALPPGELDPRHAALLASTNADTRYDQDVPEPAATRAPEPAAVRPVNTEELFDVQQQSDFFLSLGQHDQAIAVLVEHIAANPDTSALAYLDLFKIYHALGRRDEYARLSGGFERAFNAEVPAFDDFSLGGRGLEHYRGALARIESQWPASGTLALIEELVFRKPGVHEDEAFDLAAYQELLLLYAVAKEVIDPDSAPPAPVTPLSFVDTFSHDEPATAPATLLDGNAPDQRMPPPSIYGGIDDGLQADTVLIPESPVQAAEARPMPARPQIDMDLAEFDKTAFETIAAPIERGAPPPAGDSHTIDFDLFDPATEAEIAPRVIKKR
ncbi:hypothetical protein QTH89_02220 [Variovorax sp. J22G21]|uniref:type IV pilus assembly protein FimV n=1 Tax=Variovorax fucosicus TaxID=3053517 RepID=UPI00257809B3|nr:MULTISPECIES: hypothetical protein [unclassified Variovorax]MDM0040953.1 hypothetical protein [Variovorax sp. J22R193]MDM0057324.1 hypothetical protein [Variovorax sp. J22G47]MDM0060010.1 hypothetical protein [Variovorax sp. J22G21]